MSELYVNVQTFSCMVWQEKSIKISCNVGFLERRVRVRELEKPGQSQTQNILKSWYNSEAA